MSLTLTSRYERQTTLFCTLSNKSDASPLDYDQCGSLIVESLLLLETVIDARRAFVPSLLSPWPQSTDLSSLHSLLRRLQCSYGATLCAEDRVCLRLMTTLDALIQQSDTGTEQELTLIASRLSGPLALSGYLWGPSARSFYQQLDSLTGPTAREALDLRVEVLRAMSVDVTRSCFTCIHFPLSRGISADDDNNSVKGAAGQDSYDPAYITLFVLSCFGGCPLAPKALLPPIVLAQWGFLSICLRGLSSNDLPLRAVSYECLSLAQSLNLSASKAEGIRQFASEIGGNEESQPQLQALFEHVRNGTRQYLQRWPNPSTVLVAEICLGLCHPSSSHYPLLLRALLKKEAMGVNDAVDLATRLIFGGHERSLREEQDWALHLLTAGLNSHEDAAMYRKKSVFEVLAAMQGGPAVDEKASQTIEKLLERSVLPPVEM
jgi:hypothetical protein